MSDARPNAPRAGSAGGVGDPDAWVPMGGITRPHGVRGEAKVHPFNADSTLLGEVDRVALRPEGGTAADLRVVKVLSSRRAPKAWIMRLEGIEGPDAVDAMRRYEVCVHQDALPALAADEFYLRDAVGLPVEREGERIGEVVEVMFYPTMECLRCRFEDGVRELPIVRPWVERVDINAGVVRVGEIVDLPLEEGRRR